MTRELTDDEVALIWSPQHGYRLSMPNMSRARPEDLFFGALFVKVQDPAFIAKINEEEKALGCDVDSAALTGMW